MLISFSAVCCLLSITAFCYWMFKSYLESRCEKHKEQLDRPAGIKSIQLIGLLFVRREEKGGRFLKCSKACKEKKKKWIKNHKRGEDLQDWQLQKWDLNICSEPDQVSELLLCTGHIHLLPPSSVGLIFFAKCHSWWIEMKTQCSMPDF